MSTSLLYHAFGVRGYRHVCTGFRQGRVEFEVAQAPDTLRCSACGSDQVIRRGQAIRRFKTLPIGGRAVTVVLPIQRVGCQSCGRLRQVRVAFADAQKSYTRSFERYAAALCRVMTIEDAPGGRESFAGRLGYDQRYPQTISQTSFSQSEIA